jgi:hypothetical protein
MTQHRVTPAQVRDVFVIFVWRPVIGLLWAWVFCVLWHWFVVPLGAVELGVFHACGLLLLGSYLVALANIKRSKEESVANLMVRDATLPMIVVCAGLIIHWIMEM